MEFELVIFLVMLGVFLLGNFLLKLPVSLSMAAGAIAGALVGGEGIPLRHLFEGTFVYMDTVLIISMAMIFMTVIQKSGAQMCIRDRCQRVPACGGHRGRDGAGLSDHLPISAISGVGESGGGEPALWKGGAPQTALPDDPGGGRRGKARNRTIMRDKKRRSAIGLAGAFSLSGTEKAVVKIDK